MDSGSNPDSDPDPNPDPELITDPDPNLQIISDPSGSGRTTLGISRVAIGFLSRDD